ncbi:flagellar hook-basal body complex protein [Mucisphaera calidilacus]|uniref:Flagellar hook protein FlgE n=1 Tax=Mucisphaera calidilacus TaxID=2527982 RepID=A0A518BYY0_9BACT|nr:flagellar hook-basal body complex protein [Mucisphaera calidilacus]QDU72178.1 Flagellar hook protein FlgE [Mucisphaera calidilacus]
MPLTHSLFTGLSGMNGSSQMLDVVGNNIANVNTTAFKGSRIQFETQILDTIQNATAPNNERGGSNPAQIGLGVRVGAISRNFNSGALQPTGVATDMAIQGNGFFLVDLEGQELYTRAGNFTLDRDFDLVTAEGARVQGYGVDNDFQIVDGQLTNINIPIGKLTIARKPSPSSSPATSTRAATSPRKAPSPSPKPSIPTPRSPRPSTPPPRSTPSTAPTARSSSPPATSSPSPKLARAASS